jgi:hypothetical protein
MIKNIYIFFEIDPMILLGGNNENRDERSR